MTRMDPYEDEVAEARELDLIARHDPFPSAAEQAARPTYEEAEAEADRRYTEEKIAEASEGDHPCIGEWCEGKGRNTEPNEYCGYCREIDYGIDQQGEPA